jgi:hypothetical protein
MRALGAETTGAARCAQQSCGSVATTETWRRLVEMPGRKRSWEQESLSFGDVLNFSRRMLSLAKQARDLGEASGLPRGSLRNLASLLLDIEDGDKSTSPLSVRRSAKRNEQQGKCLRWTNVSRRWTPLSLSYMVRVGFVGQTM